MNKNIIAKAENYATFVHKGEFRKDGKPYIIHPEAVYNLFTSKNKVTSPGAIGCWLHDCPESKFDRYRIPIGDSIYEIKCLFGKNVAHIVSEVTTDPEERIENGKLKTIIREVLTISNEGLEVKLRDRQHNTGDVREKFISQNPKDQAWAIKYAIQTQKILYALEMGRSLPRGHKEITAKIFGNISKVITAIQIGERQPIAVA